MNITVVGIGYMGLVLAVCLAEKGHNVTCIDEDSDKIEQLKRGHSPFYEQKVAEKLVNNKNRLNFTTDYRIAYKEARVIIITTPITINEDGTVNADIIYDIVIQAAEEIERDCFVTIKSTVPIGTNDQAESIMREHLTQDIHVEFVSNPDFLRLGSAVDDLLNASHIIVGVESEAAEAAMREVYEGFQLPFVVINRRSAELLKYAANGMLSVQISFMNELADVCESVGASIEDIARGIDWDSRVSKQFMQSCLGYGEIPYIKESKSLSCYGALDGVDMRTVRAAVETHEIKKWRLMNKGKKYYADYKGLTIAILGLASKPGTDDIDQSPAVSYIQSLLEKEVNDIKVWDPIAMNNLKQLYPDEVTYCSSIEKAISEADICFILTEWPEIKYFDVYDFATYMKHPIVLDGQNCYSLCDMEEAGIVYESIGRRSIDGR